MTASGNQPARRAGIAGRIVLTASPIILLVTLFLIQAWIS